MSVLADAYLHRLDPFAIQFTETFGLRWYGLAYAAGFIIAWMGIRWFGRTGRSPLTARATGDLMTWVIVGVLVGGRLGWAIFYQRGVPLISFGGAFPWWDLLRIHEGGMASHGGILGVIAICWWFARRNEIPALHLLDVGAVVCTPGLFLGRLANFINGELWGRSLPPAQQTSLGAAPADVPAWSVKYPTEITEHWSAAVAGEPGLDHRLMALDFGISNPDPVALRAEVVAESARRLDALSVLDMPGSTLTFPGRVVEAAIEGSAPVTEVVRPLLTAYWPSQIIQAITDGPLLLGLLCLVWLKPRKPGVVGCWFLIGYGVMRIATEFVRQPDPGVALLAGLSRGQVLSVLMVVVAVAILAIIGRRDVEPMGGLLRPRGS